MGEEGLGEPPMGKDTANVLEDLTEAARNYGDLFALDPLPASDNTSLGVLALSSNVQNLLFGSSISPRNRKGPDQLYVHQGLNSYAALIAGPGKYTFAHATAGGGFVITQDRPTDAELTSLPPVVKNALLYGRAKEKLLVSNDSLRCDQLDKEGHAVLTYCSVYEFHAYVAAQVQLIVDDAASASAE